MTLLDTHVVYWLAVHPERLSRAATRAIAAADRSDGVAISTISLWELARLIDKGRIRVDGTTERFLIRLGERPGMTLLEITPQVAALAVQFPPDFPADRIWKPPPRGRMASPSLPGTALSRTARCSERSGSPPA